VIILKHWHQLPPPLFILAPPRSFTSLACAMIGQHPQTYGLPETHLLCFETMAERAAFDAQSTYPMAHGLLRAVAQLYFGEQTEASVRKAKRWLSRRSDVTTAFLFRVVMDRLFPRIPVDKSPSMAYRLDVLKRVRARFPTARYIHLLRHPRGHGESVMKYLEVRAKRGPVPPSHWLLRISSVAPPSAAPVSSDTNRTLDPQYGWYAINRTIADFLADIPAAQSVRIRGEDLLGGPEECLRDVAAWMGLRTDHEAIDRMKHPERSPYAFLGPPGARYGNDAFFLENPVLRGVRAANPLSLEGALRWRNDGEGFCPEVKLLARQFGYE
jgi:Sulfotransferase family